MVALTMPQLGIGAGSAGGDVVRGVSGVQRAAFDDALARSGAKNPTSVDPTSVDPASTVDPAAPARPPGVEFARAAATYENDAASRDLVRRSLELGAPAPTTQGDAILGGLQRLRGTFDARHDRIRSIMGSQAVDTNALLAMQMEVAQYTLLVDVSSKLTGKTTQSLDALMKGQ